MVLIVDSGSTKSDWVLLDGEKVVNNFKTMGFNPFFHNETVIANAIRYNDGLKACSKDVRKIYYYGAGCSSEALNTIIKRALKSVFTKATAHVDHDLLAAAYATYNGQPSIACILGTGSNSCHFDGEKIYEEVPALAYVLGDEGSGSYYGKKLLSAFLYGQLPEHLHNDLVSKYNLDKDTIFENVYRKPHANVYLASFMKFLSDHRDDPYFKSIVVEGMKDFMSVHVCCYPDHKNLQVHFIGSIGFFFEDELKEAAKDLGINVGQIVRKPIDGLVNYHMKREVQEPRLKSAG